MATLKLTNVGKTYGGTVDVLKDINLDIETGELIVFVGPSGCGKSTLLRMIAGLERITQGELQIDGRVVNDIPPAQRGIAMVFQSYALYPHMTVRDNMTFALKLAKKSKEEIDAAVSKAARILQLEPYLDRLPKALSGGQRQRVAIGRSIVRDPKVYLFDEPLSNLDAALRVATRIEIAQLKETMPESTMIYVTHDQVEAMTLADKIVVMHDGRIEQIGTPMELFLNPANAFVAGFLGAPPMNQIKATIAAGDTGPVAMFGDQTLALAPLADLQNAVGREVIVGVRPEYAAIVTENQPGAVRCGLELVETLGSEALLHMTLGDAPFVIRTETLGNLDRLNAVNGFTVAPELIKIFDGKTGLALSGQTRAA